MNVWQVPDGFLTTVWHMINWKLVPSSFSSKNYKTKITGLWGLPKNTKNFFHNIIWIKSHQNPSLQYLFPLILWSIELLNNKFHGLSPSGGFVSPSGGFASLMFDQAVPQKLPAPSSQSERHLHFASIRLCLALLFIISIVVPFKCSVMFCFSSKCKIRDKFQKN